MPVVKVFGLNSSPYSWEEFASLEHRLKAVVVSVEELRVRDDQVTVFLVKDLLNEGPLNRGSQGDIVIDVTGITDKPERTETVRQRLASYMVDSVKHFVEEIGDYKKHGLIECFIHPFNRSNGYASA